MYNIIDSGLNIIITFNGAITRSVPKSSISYGFTNGEKVLQVKGSQNPYDVLASWDISTISSLNNSATLQDGFDYLQSIIDNGVQAILGSLNSFDSEADALSDGLINGNFWFDQTDKLIKRIWNYIQSYTAGLSTIGFVNNGGDDWDIEFKIAPTSVQLPTGYSIVDFFANVVFWTNGVDTYADYTNQVANLTVNKSGLGAGVYQMSQIFSVSNGVDTKSFVIGKLVKVDGVGGIIAQIDVEGITINSINGLMINATVHINQVGCSYPIQWNARDNTYAIISVLGNNFTQAMVLPASTAILGVSLILDSVFTNDFTGQIGAASTITIQ